MKVISALLFASGLLLSSVSCFTQQDNEIDSLKNRLRIAQSAADSSELLWWLARQYVGNNPEEVKKYAGLALKTALSTPDSVQIAKAFDMRALVYWTDGDIEMAIEHYKKSAEIAIRHWEWETCAWANWNIFKIEIERSNTEQALFYARKSAAYFEKAKKPINALNCYYSLGKANLYPYTDSLILRTKNYLQQDYDDNTRLFLLLHISNLYELQENRNESMSYLQEAVELADDTQNLKGTIKVYNAIASYLKNTQNNYPVALKYYKKSAEIKEQNNIDGVGGLYIEIGDLHRLMHNDSTALDYFNKGLKSGVDNNHRHTQASGYMKIGDLNYQNKNYADALENYLKCYSTGCDHCPPITFHYALINIANVYASQKDHTNAMLYYNKALLLADSSGSIRAQALSYQVMADYYNESDKSKAKDLYVLAYNLSKDANYLQGQQYSSDKLSSIYGDLNNFSEAYHYLSKSKQLSDSINKINEADNLAKLETHLDFRNLQTQRELDKAVAEEEVTRQKLIRNFSLMVVLFLFVLMVIIFLGYRRKKGDNKKLEEQKKDIENMSQKVHEADQAKLDFYTNVSHEFRTPLTVILGMAEKLRVSADESGTLKTIRKNSLRLLQLVNHLLDLRRLDVAGVSLKVSQSDILEFSIGIVSSFDELASKKQVNFSFTHEIARPMMYFDRDKMEKILANLLSNAIKYTNPNGNIDVYLSDSDGEIVKVTVKDTGIGISEKHLPNIFNRFYRVSESRNQGSGIGLAVLKELVDLHKGEIDVESEEGIGSTFTLTVPCRESAYSSTEIVENDLETISESYVDNIDFDEDTLDSPEQDVNQKSILVVEDNKDLRDFIAGVFQAEFSIIKARDGREGVEAARKHIPDIIISDIMMPNLSGIELVDQIKNDQRTSHIPVILLTAKSDIASQIRGYDKGADEYLSKPFDSQFLKSRVHNLLRIRSQLVEKFSKQFSLQPREVSIENADQKFLQKTIEVIEQHIADPNLNVDLLAMELGVSRTQLYRKLKALTDYSANQFIRIIRLKRAAQILKQGQNNIAEVMDATGFSNYSHFNNCFKEYFGEYPKDYMLLSLKGSLN